MLPSCVCALITVQTAICSVQYDIPTYQAAEPGGSAGLHAVCVTWLDHALRSRVVQPLARQVHRALLHDTVLWQQAVALQHDCPPAAWRRCCRGMQHDAHVALEVLLQPLDCLCMRALSACDQCCMSSAAKAHLGCLTEAPC